MSPSLNLRLKAEKMPIKRSTFISLSTHNASSVNEIVRIKPKIASSNYLNIGTFQLYSNS
jgi:hypothetical protein